MGLLGISSSGRLTHSLSEIIVSRKLNLTLDPENQAFKDPGHF